MSGFILERVHGAASSRSCPESYKAIIKKKGHAYSGKIEERTWTLRLYSNPSHDPYSTIAWGPNRSFCTYVGTLMFRRHTGKGACENMLPILCANPASVFEEIFGNFILIWQDADCLHIRSDTAGLNHFYTTNDVRTVSNYFLVSVLLDRKRELSNRGIEQYIYLGATFGRLTPFSSIRRIKPEEQVQVRGSSFSVSRSQYSWIKLQATSKNIQDRLCQTRESFRQYFENVRSCFGNNIRASLTGGFDSRLLLSCLLDIGIRPSLFVFGNKNSSDVLIASKLARSVGLEIDSVDRLAALPVLPPDAFWDSMEQQHVGLDGVSQYGSAWYPDEYSHRPARNGPNVLHLNGGGGEIWRFFWRPYTFGMTLRRFAKDNYQGRFKFLGTGFANERAFLHGLSEDLADILGVRSGEPIDRLQYNSIYARFRLTYWQGANNTIDNHLGISLTPFSECRFSVAAADLPDSLRGFGAFEAKLITDLNPELASIVSNYGHRFDQPVAKFRRIIGSIDRNIAPPPLFASLYRQIKPRERRPYFLAKNYIQAGFPGQLLSKEFVDIETLKCSMAVSRLLTIEKLLRAC